MWNLGVQQQAKRILGEPLQDAQIDAAMFADALRNVLRGAERVLGRGHRDVTAFRERVPDAVNVRDMFEHFDAYVEGRGRRQADGQVGTSVGSWRPLISRGAECRVRIGPYEIEIATAAEASARLMNATQEAAESPGG